MIKGKRQDWAVFLLMNDLDSLGGSSQLFCTIALELQRAGHLVSVYTDHPPPPDNRYVSRLRESGIPVNAGLKSYGGGGLLQLLLLPVRLATASAAALVSRRSFARAWQRIGARLDRALVHRRFSRRGRRAFLEAVKAARRSGRTVLAHVHRGANGVRWAYAARLPVVYVENSTPTPSAHIDWWFATDPSPESNAAKGWHRLRRVSRWIDLIIVGSERAAQGIRDQVGYGGPIATLPWMVEAVRRDADPAAREPTGTLVVGTAGRLESEKGHSFLIEAMPRVLQSTAARLVVAGAGSLRAALEDLAARLGVREHIEFCGAQDDVGMEQFWSRIDLLVLPSLREGSPLVGLEAMARGIPVIATDVGGVSELLGNGRCGRVVEARSPAALADAILEMAADPVRRQTLAQAGYDRFMSVYAPSSAMPLWLETYERVLDRWDAKARSV
jgi:glycosyltransferase involved in cell wall biosynthesis